jgi:cyclopropane fatty-acyl-phospholipid synthase-like methyltransferase
MEDGSILGRCMARARRWATRRYWERTWRRDDLDPPWLGRAVSPEIVEAVEAGWFPPGAPALDIGCGEGDVAAWLAARGFPALGIDNSSAAIDRARRRHDRARAPVEFRRLDICAAPPAAGRFGALVDRGCFHTIGERDARAYARNVALAAREGARLLLFVKAFREGSAFGDPAERERAVARVEAALSEHFTTDRVAVTEMGARAGDDAGAAAAGTVPIAGPVAAPRLPGLVVWMTRRTRTAR